MSLLNVHVTPERALIAVDTDGVGPDGHFEIPKMYPLAHANVILAGQGDRKFLLDAFAWICLATDSVDYDVIVESMPGILRRMASAARANQVPDIRYSLAVVGYSPKEHRICGRWYEGVITGEQFDVFSLGSRIAPWESDEKPPPPDSLENHVELARKQTAYHKAKNHAGGGRLILAELTPEGMAIRKIADLG